VVVLISVLAVLMLFVFHRVNNRRGSNNRLRFWLHHALTPIAILVVVWSLQDFIKNQITVLGGFSTVVVVMATILIHAAAVWLLWLVMLAIFKYIVQTPKYPGR
jgi:chromate transport protein ChrA